LSSTSKNFVQLSQTVLPWFLKRYVALSMFYFDDIFSLIRLSFSTAL